MAERKPVEAHERFTRAFNAGDIDALMELYEPDAILIGGPDQPTAKGAKEIRAALEGYLAAKGKITLTTRHVHQNGDVALLRGQWTLKGTGPDGQPMEMSHGSAEVVRRQKDGSWRYVIDDPFGSDT